MSDGRKQVLANVRRALQRGPVEGAAKAALEERLAKHPRGPVPARGQLDRAGRLDLFQEMAEEASATLARVADWAEVPAALADYLRQHNEPSELRLAPHPDLTGLDWANAAPNLTVSQGKGEADTAVGVSRGFAGVAETGTLILRSGPDSPTTLNFLPATHVVVLTAGDVVGAYEEAWDRLRDEVGAGNVPRTVNMITGPSRTADIEQTLQLGAHGPMNLHILVVDDGRG